MKMNYIKKILMLFALSAATISCEDDDQVGDSQLVPSSPTIAINLGFSNPVLIEDDSVFEYIVTLSEAQIVDVKLHVSQIDGTASSSDYEMGNLITIPAGYTSAKGNIKILSDELIEGTETLKIQIGDNRTANATITPVTIDFTILNYTEGDLLIDLGWGMSEPTTDNSGEEIDPTDFADMRLLVSSTPDNLNAGDNVADGSGFESLVLPANTPDGVYYVVADFYDANADIIRDLDLSLELNQAGVINGDSYDFAAAINNASICENNFFVLGKLTKSGDTYTFENLAINNFENQKTTWLGTDADYDSQVTTGVDCDGKIIAGLNAGWIDEFWGEIITKAGTIHYTVDAAGDVMIENQFLFTTTYNGDVQPDYYIEGTGTYDAVAGTLNLKYSLIQDGWYLGEDYGEADGFFHATLTAAN